MRTVAAGALLALALPAAAARALPPGSPALGERIYREGILPSGKPVPAVVEGDIPIDGSFFSCESCHLRAGIGSFEGTVLTLPTSAAYLAAPYRLGTRLTAEERERIPARYRSAPLRPAYGDEDLARALRAGIDPTGRAFDRAMPRYVIGDEDLAHLVAYLRVLSAAFSPGVDGETMTFACVYSDDLPPARRDAMLLPLERYFADRAARAPYYQQRARATPFKERMEVSARIPRLLRWELRGPREGWRAQLEEHLRREPVFALVGGMVSGSWEPVHRFCEEHRVPSLMPLTDLPVIAEADWYTLYLSKGRYQEGEAAARFVRRAFAGRGPAPLVSVAGGSAEEAAAARGFAETLARLGLGAPREIPPPRAGAEASWVAEVAAAARGGALALWLGGDDALAMLEPLAAAEGQPEIVLAASGLIGDRLGRVPEAARSSLRLTWPRRLPAETAEVDAALRAWLRSRGLADDDLRTAHRVYTLGWLITDAVMMLGQDFYRDYLLDVVDMGQDRTHTSGIHPRLSFGPGQRYAAKGCYVVQLGPGPEPQILPRSEWVVH